MAKIGTTGKGSVKLPSKTSLERQGVCARQALNFGHSHLGHIEW